MKYLAYANFNKNTAQECSTIVDTMFREWDFNCSLKTTVNLRWGRLNCVQIRLESTPALEKKLFVLEIDTLFNRTFSKKT